MENNDIDNKGEIIKDKQKYNSYMKEYMKDYMKEKREQNNENIICDICGGHYKKYASYQHKKTKKHQACINVVEKINIEMKKIISEKK
jgi:hypothetical protein